MKKERKFCGFDSVFATRLRALMESRKITQLELSKQIGTTRQAVSQYFDGSVLPNIEKLYLIAKYFDVSADYLLGNTNAQKADMQYAEINKMLGLSDKSIEVLSRSVLGSDVDDLAVKLFGGTIIEGEAPLPEGWTKEQMEKFVEDDFEECFKDSDTRTIYTPTFEIINILCEEINNTVDFRDTVLQLIGAYLLHIKNPKGQYGIFRLKYDERGCMDFDGAPFADVTDDDLLAVKMLKLQQKLAELKESREMGVKK